MLCSFMETFSSHRFGFLLFFFFFFFFAVPTVHSVYFKVSRFKPNDPTISYQGDARANGDVDFTDAEFLCRAGWATYSGRVPLWNPDTGELADFTTNFSFMIGTRNTSSFGHGFAFFLAPAGIQISPNSGGGFVGLFNQTTSYSSLYPLVHVEFDSYKNTQWDPLDVDTHAGINNNSLSSAIYTTWNASSHSQEFADVRIMYNSATKNLSVSWKYIITSDPRENSSLHYIIDLAKILPQWVTVGFSASTGMNLETNRLQSWEFSSSLDIKVGKQTTTKLWLVIAIPVAGFVLLTSALVVFTVMRRQKQRKRKAAEAAKLISINEDLERGAGPRRFSYKDLASATNNFSAERKLGEGGFGAVYRGYFNHLDTMVAVKKFAGGSKQGKKEFITEVKIISSLRHRNLVQLIGWCHEKDEFLLIYEFMPNGSLDSHLFGKRAPLAWAVRYKISLGLASALLYLHEEWEQCVLHRDVKASNIMLDSNFNVKLGDFGLARLMDHELGPQTTGLAGTFGYMAPEYISTGRASKESDVYSFGVVVLEIVTGRKSVDPRQGRIEPEKSLVERVWDLYGRGELITAIDEKLGSDFYRQQAECVMVVGLWCAHPDRNSRPSIKRAIQVLNFEAALPTLPPKMPVATYHVSSSSNSVCSGGASVTFSSAQVGR